jgi:nucleoside-diphosphate-sugar epimerase
MSEHPADGRHYVVTGGAGFIGSHVAVHMLGAGHRVTLLDNLSTGSRDNVAAVRAETGADERRLRLVEASVTDPDAVREVFADADGAVHLAALPSVVRSVEAPLESHEHNVTGTVNVLDAARRRGVRVVYAGSSSAYGDQDVQYKHEELRESPLSPYAASKLAGELYARSFGAVYDASIVVTRFFNVYGPRQVPDSPYSGVIAAFCFALLHGRSPRVDGDGGQTRDFTYVGDVAKGVCLALERDLAPGCHTVNLAGGGNHSILDTLNVLKRCAGSDVEPTFAPARAGDVRHSQADVSRLRELIDYVPDTSFDTGLARTFEWYQQTYGSTRS